MRNVMWTRLRRILKPCHSISTSLVSSSLAACDSTRPKNPLLSALRALHHNRFCSCSLRSYPGPTRATCVRPGGGNACKQGTPKMQIPLSDAIQQLRDELRKAILEGKDQDIKIGR